GRRGVSGGASTRREERRERQQAEGGLAPRTVHSRHGRDPPVTRRLGSPSGPRAVHRPGSAAESFNPTRSHRAVTSGDAAPVTPHLARPLLLPLRGAALHAPG